MYWKPLRRKISQRILGQFEAETRSTEQRGSILLVAVGILMLLSVMATAFVANMSLERKATRNYVDSVKARLIAEAGLARSIEEQRTRVFESGITDTSNLYGNGDFWLPLQVTRDYINAGLPNDPFRASIVGTIGQSYNNGVDRYKIKIVDTQSQFNLNTRFAGGDESHELMYTVVIRSLGAAIAESVPRMNAKIGQAAREKGLAEFQDLLFPPGNPFDRCAWPRNTDQNGNPSAGATRRGVDAIIALINSKPNQRFQSKSELLECMDEADYRVVRDFLTANSFLDPKSVSANADIGRSRILRFGGAVLPPTNISANANSSAGAGSTSLRAPININSAPQEVLLAMLAPIAGQRVYIHTGNIESAAYRQVDQASDFTDIALGELGELVLSATNHTVDSNAVPIGRNSAYGAQKYLVAFPPLGLQLASNNVTFKQLAKDIVTAIVARRSQPSLGGPFKSFMDWDRFLEDRIWPMVAAIDPITTADHKPEIFGIVNGVDKEVDAQVYNEIVNGKDFKYWYQRSLIGMLKSAMNPNDRYSQFNPSQALFVEVDKGSLVSFASHYESPVGGTAPPQQNRRSQVAQTCEWCFSTKGVFELVALGEITTNATQKLLEVYGYQSTSARIGTGGAQYSADIHAQVKLRSVLRIFGEVTHTSQQDFAKNGHAGKGIEPGNVQVVGFPIVDEDRSYDGAPVFRRSNMRSYPVDEKYWWAQTINNGNGPIQRYQPSEVGGLKGDDSLFASSGAGHIELAPHLVTTTTQKTDDIPVESLRPSPENLSTGSSPANLFELRFDHSRSADVLRDTYSSEDLSENNDSTRLRIASIVADVAGAQFLSGDNNNLNGKKPRDNRHYRSKPIAMGHESVTRDATLFYPIVPFPVMSPQNDRYMVRGTKTLGQRWETSLVTIDGLYMSDHTAFDRRTNIIPQFFPTYRATFTEPDRFVSTARPINSETKGETFRRQIGVDGAGVPSTQGQSFSDWPEYPNIQATQGLISFWYKPDFDWNNPTLSNNPARNKPTRRYCGFFSVTTAASPSVRVPGLRTDLTTITANPPTAGMPPYTATGSQLPLAQFESQSNPARLANNSMRGTQMHFMRMPSGELRLIRLYFEKVGIPLYELNATAPSDSYQAYSHYDRRYVREASTLYSQGAGAPSHGSPLHSLPMLMNPYYRMPQADWGMTYDAVLELPHVQNGIFNVGARPFSNLKLRAKLENSPYLNFRAYTLFHELHDVVVEREGRGALAQNPLLPAYRLPPCFPYPPIEMYLPQVSMMQASDEDRRVIDSSMNRSRITVGRYEVTANPTRGNLNPDLMDLKRSRWYHIAVAWNDAAANGQIYVDGTLLDCTPTSRRGGASTNYVGYDWESQSNVIVRDLRDVSNKQHLSWQMNAAVTAPPLPKFVNLNQSLDVNIHEARLKAGQNPPEIYRQGCLGHFRDELVVGGIFRRQHPGGVIPSSAPLKVPTGIFKHIPAGDLVCISCNGTIDDFCVSRLPKSTGPLNSQVPSFSPSLIRDRYFRGGGIWTQWVPEFDGLSGAGAATQIVSCRFTGYVPYTLRGQGGNFTVNPLQGASIRVRLFVADPRKGTSNLQTGAQLSEVSAVLGEKLWPSRGGATGGDSSGLDDTPVLDLSKTPIAITEGRRLLYQVVLQPGVFGDSRGVRGIDQSNAIASPIFDSITFVYKLAGNQVLLREQVFD